MLDTIKPIYWHARFSYRLLTNRVRALPDFIILGTQRGGTTSLYHYLTEYAGVFSAMHKEVHFFDDHFSEGLRWYRAQFPTSLQRYYTERIRKQRFVTGESSPYYLFHPHVPKRVLASLPQVRLIVLLRNPIDRAYSHHWLAMHEGHETLPFEKALKCEEERLAGEEEKMLVDEEYESYNHRHYTYLSRGIYIDQLQRWMSTFPREQFLIVKSEDLYSDPAASTRQCLEFLGMPASTLDTTKEYKQYREPTPAGHKNQAKPPRMDAGLRKTLVEYFKPHNARLHAYLGRDFDWDR